MHPSLLYAYSRPNPPDPTNPYPPFETWKKIYDELQSREEKLMKEMNREVRRSGIKAHNAVSVRAANKEFSLRVACWRAQKTNPFIPKPQGF